MDEDPCGAEDTERAELTAPPVKLYDWAAKITRISRVTNFTRIRDASQHIRRV